jgi:hypothetical protein
MKFSICYSCLLIFMIIPSHVYYSNYVAVVSLSQFLHSFIDIFSLLGTSYRSSMQTGIFSPFSVSPFLFHPLALRIYGYILFARLKFASIALDWWWTRQKKLTNSKWRKNVESGAAPKDRIGWETMNDCLQDITDNKIMRNDLISERTSTWKPTSFILIIWTK